MAAITCSKGRCCKWTSGIIGVVALVTGCVLIQVFHTLIHDKVEDNLPLTNGSDSYKNWVSSPVPIYFQVWVLDIVNHDEVIAYGAVPSLVEKGPYTYREKRQKVNITFEDGGEVISYREKQFFYFDRSKSVGPESDSFTTVNLPMLTIANIVRYEFDIIKDAVNFILDETNEHLFINLTVGQLMWGYEDSLIKDVKTVAAKFGIHLPIDDKFGLFYNKNGSDDGLYRIWSGVNTMDKFAEILTWNGNTSLDYWNSEIANGINGSDGTLYPPFVDSSQPRYLFSSDLCRSLRIDYVDDYTLKGIDVDRFVVRPVAFANVSTNPDNEGFCTPETNCLPAGLLNASVCRDGAPIIMSLPHFLYSEPTVQDRVNMGSEPEAKDYQSVIDIEPMTGVVMNAAKRLQLNAYLTNISHIRDTEKLSDYIIMPILWLNESAVIDDKSADDFKKQVLMVVKLTEAIQYGLIALGGFFLVCVLVIFVKGFCATARDREMKVFSDEKTPILTSA